MSNEIDYKNVLNPAQLEAVMTLDGPVLVIAGAGSGKTRTLIYRLARLVEAGVPPEEILLLTFTRRAAQEMLERATGLADSRCRFVSGGTFHSLAHRILTRNAGLLGLTDRFTILDRSDMEDAIKALIPELRVPKGAPRFPKRGTLANILSKAANLQQPIDEFMAEEYGQFIEFTTEITALARLYADYKKTRQLMDYDDLILNLRALLSKNQEVRSDLNRQYRYVMVDEYQDTNAIQADIVKWLAYKHQNIMVVGDDSQSIYSFRGANYRNMFDFPSLFSDTKIIKLEENYRSSQPILQFTNALMEQAHEKYTECLYTRREGGKLPKVVDTRTDPGQAMFICRHLQKKLQEGRSIKDFAVLFRAGYHSFELEAALTRQGIPYVKHGGFKFLESSHIKDVLAHLRVLVNGEDTLSWDRVLRLLKNVGPGKSRAIIHWMQQEKTRPGRINEWPGVNKRIDGLKALSRLFTRLSVDNIEPGDATNSMLEYYDPILKEKFDDYPRRRKELKQLAEMAGHNKNLKEFLDGLALDPPTSSMDIHSEKGTKTLTLSTVHSAKGLEWPVVFILWVMEGRFPASRSYNDPALLEEERRLMYVAATRAKDQLIMCYPGQESLPFWFTQKGQVGGLSSFVQGLPEEIVSYESTGVKNRFSTGSGRRVPPSKDIWKDRTSASGLSRGDRVSHPAFGPGVVSKFIGSDKVEVLFKNVGRKLLHLEYTTLDKA
ncbi:ATP-dependent helicase [bacterium]|nr:ATP-dependent helicase [bacterium]